MFKLTIHYINYIYSSLTNLNKINYKDKRILIDKLTLKTLHESSISNNKIL